MNPFAQVGQESLSVIAANKTARAAAAEAAKRAKLEAVYDRAKPYLDVLAEEITPEAVREKIVPKDTDVVYLNAAEFPIPQELAAICLEFCRLRRHHSDTATILAELSQEVTPKLARTFKQLEEAKFEVWMSETVIGLTYQGSGQF